MAKYIFLLIFLLGAAALFFLVCRSRCRRKKALFLGSCALLFLLLALLGTLVGSLIRFNTAEGVFRYMAHGKVECVLEGRESAAVFYRNGSTGSVCFALKDGEKYRLPDWPEAEPVKNEIRSGTLLTFYQPRGTQDVYVRGSAPAGASIHLLMQNGEIPSDIIVAQSDRFATVFYFLAPQGD